MKPKPPATGGPADNIPLTGLLLTVDQRTCVGVCTTNPIPGQPNAPSPPSES